MKKLHLMALSQIRFCKKFLGSLLFGDAVNTDIHEEPKNKLTTKFAAKGRICDSTIIIAILFFATSCQMLLPKPLAHNITFYGIGEVKAIPDVANFVITVRIEEKDVFLAQQKMTQKTNRALELLAQNGVEKPDIQTTNYSTSPKYSYEPKPCQKSICPPAKQVLTGFEASQTISLKLRNLDKAGQILSDLANIEIAEVNGPNFAIENLEKLKSQAQAQAIEKAKLEAVATAKNLGVILKKIVDFREEPQGFQHGFAMARTYSSISPQALGQLEVGQEKISSKVAITYEIE